MHPTLLDRSQAAIRSSDVEIRTAARSTVVIAMDYEVELNYRLTGHLESGESVRATLISIQHGIYAATDRRILCLNNEVIGYRMRVHPYECLDRVDCITEDGASFVQFMSGERVLMVRARSEREARRFVEAVMEVLAGRVVATEQAV